MKRVTLIMTLLLALCGAVVSQTPTDVLDKMTQRLTAGGVTSNFMLLNKESSQAAPIAVMGKGTMLGKKFVVTTEGMTIGYDGKTQWVYNSDDDEITLSEPTPDEAAKTNPLLLVDTFRKRCNIIFSVTEKDPNMFVVEFYAKDKFADLKCLTIYVNKVSYVPARIVMTTYAGSSTEVKFMGVKTGQKIDAAVFAFDSQKYPTAEINDIRM